MKKQYYKPEVEVMPIVASHRLMDGTGLLPGNGQGDAQDILGPAPYRY